MITKYVIWDSIKSDVCSKSFIMSTDEEWALQIFFCCICSIVSIPIDIILSPIEIFYLLILYIVKKKRKYY